MINNDKVVKKYINDKITNYTSLKISLNYLILSVKYDNKCFDSTQFDSI